MTTLARIRTKVRRLTASPSTSQLSESDLDDAINDFYTGNLPGLLRTFNLRETYTFYTEANVDVYDFPKNTYSSILPPFYIGGYQSYLSQSRDEFYRIYPSIDSDQDLVTGNGTVGPYTATITAVPVLRRGPPTGADFSSRVTISAVDSTGASVVATDTVVTGDVGTLTGVGVAAGTINYLNGAVSITFTNSIPSGNQINSQTVSYQASRPDTILFYNDQFTMRPVPDKAYKCEVDAYILPIALLNANDNPEVDQWWEYIAFGAAKKIFEERQDLEGVNSVMPALKEQETIVQRRTLIQNSSRRTATIYSETGHFPYGYFGYGQRF